MTKIKDYTEDVNISDNDILLGSDKDNVSKTKNYKIGRLKDYILSFVEGVVGPQGPQGEQGIQGEIGPQGPPGESGIASLPYLEYSCILTQEFENEFSKTIINNELSSDITITRIFQGRFGIKFPGIVNVYKIVLGETLIYTPNGYALLYVDYSDTYTLYDVIIDTFENLSDIPTTKSDFIFFKTPLSFKIYN